MKPAYLFAAFLLLIFSGCDTSEPEDIVLEDPVPSFVADSVYIVTESGLMYHDLIVGDTTRVRADSGDVVRLNYHGWLDGVTFFDSSLLQGAPLEFVLGVGNVIPGMDEGINGMYLGGERQIVIPPELGYGQEARGIIPANSTLMFEVVLIGTQ
ncbi:MAG: FKBP-type peptidyl-prolyl cis-trans isomerase [Rhodothermales bacterium]